jgi:hypothetical protein
MGVPLLVLEEKNGNRGRFRCLVYTASFAMVSPGRRLGETHQSKRRKSGCSVFRRGINQSTLSPTENSVL